MPLEIQNNNYAASTDAITAANNADNNAHHIITTEKFRTTYPELTRWTESLNNSQKQEIRQLVSWLSFASYHYGKEMSAAASRGSISTAVLGEEPHFPISENAFLHYVNHGLSDARPLLQHIKTISASLLDAACHELPGDPNKKAEHAPYTKALLHLLEPRLEHTTQTDQSLHTASSTHTTYETTHDTTQHNTEITLETFINECHQKPFNTWPAKIKSFIFTSTSFKEEDGNAYERNSYTRGANLSHINLEDVTIRAAYGLEQCNLSRANLRNADLSDLDMRGFNLKEACLVNALLIRANLEGANLDFADLMWANLDEANISQTSLIAADLTETQMEHVHLWGADFTGAELLGTQVSLHPFSLNYVSDDRRSFLLDHENNASNKSLLLTIASIDNKFYKLKNQLMYAIVDALEKTKAPCIDVSGVEESLKILLDEESNHYFEIPALTRCINTLCDKEIQLCNHNVRPHQDNRLSLLIDHALYRLQEKGWALQNNAAIHQLLYEAEKGNNIFQTKAKVLRTIFINDESIRSRLPIHIRDLDHRKYSPGYFHLCSLDANTNMLIFHKDLYEKFLLSTANIENISSENLKDLFHYQYKPDTQTYQYKKVENLVELAETLPAFPLLHNIYLQKQDQVCLLNFIDTLNLKRLAPFFKKAVKENLTPNSLVTSPNQTVLNTIFEPLMHRHKNPSTSSSVEKNSLAAKSYVIDKQATIKEEHLANIYKSFQHLITDSLSGLTHNDPSQARQDKTAQEIQAIQKTQETQEEQEVQEVRGAQETFKKTSVLLSLAVLFTRLSSEAFFGTAQNSPTALRQYAIALLNTAYALDPDFFEQFNTEAKQARRQQTHMRLYSDAIQALTKATDSQKVFDIYLDYLEQGFSGKTDLPLRMQMDAQAYANNNSTFKKIFKVVVT